MAGPNKRQRTKAAKKSAAKSSSGGISVQAGMSWGQGKLAQLNDAIGPGGDGVEPADVGYTEPRGLRPSTSFFGLRSKYTGGGSFFK